MKKHRMCFFTRLLANEEALLRAAAPMLAASAVRRFLVLVMRFPEFAVVNCCTGRLAARRTLSASRRRQTPPECRSWARTRATQVSSQREIVPPDQPLGDLLGRA
jgi:hypothetical protein